MNTIYKYELENNPVQNLTIPKGAIFLSLQVQSGITCAWFQVDTTAENETYSILTYGTGWVIDNKGLYGHIGTVRHDPLVWHIFKSLLPIK